MIRIFIAHGTAQLLFLAGALSQYHENFSDLQFEDILLLSRQNAPENMRKAMFLMAKAVWAWRDIIWIDHLIRPSSPSYHRDVRTELNRILKDYGKPNHLWFCMPYEPVAQICMSLFKDSQLHLFDDGLGTYIDINSIGKLLLHPKRLMRFVGTNILKNSVVLRRLFQETIYKYPIKPVTCSHLFLAPEITIPDHLQRSPISLVSTSAMRRIIELVKKELAISSLSANHFPHNSKRVLIMGQYFSKLNPTWWEKELGIYNAVIKAYQDFGYDVWWKEHPKAIVPFREHLQRIGSRISVFESNDAYPIELFVSETMFQQTASVSSSSLFTLQKLYGIEPRTFVNLLPFDLPGTLAYANQIIKKSIKIYDDNT